MRIRARSWIRRAWLSTSPGTRQRRRTGLEVLREDGPHLQRRLQCPPVLDPAPPGPPVPEPRSHEGRGAAHRRQHDRKLHHQHELAVLRRRVHDVVLDADGRPRRPELRLCSGGDGRADRSRPRNRAPLEQQPRKLLARPLSVARLHPAAAGDRPGRAAHLAGGAADVPRPCDGDDAAGRAPDDRTRPGRLADRDQAARHERRRLLQLELVGAVRKPERLLELPRDARDPVDSGGAGVHVRQARVRPPARADGVHRDVHRLRARRGGQPAGGATWVGRSSAVGRQHHAGQWAVGRQYVRQGSPLRPGQVPRSGPSRRAMPRTAR